MRINYLIFNILIFGFLIIFSNCSNEEDVPVIVDFSVNGKKVGKTLQVKTKENLIFTNTSTPKNSIENVQWYFKNNERADVLGNKASRLYNKTGDYTIKMCVNKNTNLCKQISINVTKNQSTKPAQYVQSIETIKPKISVDFSVNKTTVTVGEELTFFDESTIKNIIQITRSWSVNGEKRSNKTIFKYKFEKLGESIVKYCINEKCTTKSVIVEAIPSTNTVIPPQKEVITKKTPIPKPFNPTNIGNIGISSDEKCGTTFSSKKNSIQLTPNQRVQLTEVTVFANDNGKVAVRIEYQEELGKNKTIKLTSSKGKAVLHNDYAQIRLKKIILEPSIIYTLIVEPKKTTAGGIVQLHSSKGCVETKQSSSNPLKIDYLDDIVLYDIKYKY